MRTPKLVFTFVIGVLAIHCSSAADRSSPACSETRACAASGASGASGSQGAPGASNGGGAGNANDGAGAGGCSACDGGVLPDGARPGPVATSGALPRVVAYVNCLCGFGAGAQGGACLANPDPNVNHVKSWEDDGVSPITHYVISFLSFKGNDIQSDPGSIWQSGGGSTSDFALEPHLRDAMRAAQARGKKVVLSIGGEVGSSGFVSWWNGSGTSTDARVSTMRAKLEAVADAFTAQNGVHVDGFDVDIELGGVYQYTSDKYAATRDLINAVPEKYLVAFVPQVGNGLCAAPSQGDPLPPPTVLGGQCQQPVNGDDSSWTLARLDKDCTKSDGTPKLDYFGIQYYNAGQAECCGGGSDATAMVRSTAQNYANLANGWAASGDTTLASSPWHAWAYYPGPWAQFAGIGADRLVLGKPGCQGCAGSNYLDLASMQELIGKLDGRLAKTMGGILFWDLCRLFGNQGTQCVSGQCQPSWGGQDVLANLTDLKARMNALHARQ